MIESRFSIRPLFGFLLLALGFVGFGYLFWVYTIWGLTLPDFDKWSIFEEKEEVAINKSSAGFGQLLGNQDGTEKIIVVDADNPIKAPVENLTGEIAVDRDQVDSGTSSVLGSGDYFSGQVSLTVPRLSIEDAAVELDVNGDNEWIYDTVLTRAVAHLQYSAYPGGFGNTFLFGHSKLPIFAGNDYESIFTNLPKVKVGDVVKLKYEGSEYTYQISQTGVVDPDDVFIMNQPPTSKMLTLMTCIPPGFENHRYITVGNLIDIEDL